MGTLYFRCNQGVDQVRHWNNDLRHFMGDGATIADAGKCCLAFMCIALPFILVATVACFARGFKLTGNKALTLVANICCWLSFLFLSFTWPVFEDDLEPFHRRSNNFSISGSCCFNSSRVKGKKSLREKYASVVSAKYSIGLVIA